MDAAVSDPTPPRRLAEARALLAGLGALERARHHGTWAGAGGAAAASAAGAHADGGRRGGRAIGGAAGRARPAARRAGGPEPAPVGDCVTYGDLPLTIRSPHMRRTVDRIRLEARRLTTGVARPTLSAGQMAALAYPDRVGMRRKGDAPRWVLSGGKGVAMDAGDPMAGARLIVVTDTDGDPREAWCGKPWGSRKPNCARCMASGFVWRDGLRMVAPRRPGHASAAGMLWRVGAGRSALADAPARRGGACSP